MKLLLINDTTAHHNWGAQATPAALRWMMASAMPQADITWLPNEWLHRSYSYLKIGNSVYRRGAIPHAQWLLDKLSWPTDFFPSVADEFEAVADEWARGDGGPPAREFLRLASGADAVVFNAENSIYRNTSEGCRGIFLLWFAKTKLGRVAAAINQTAHITGVRPIMKGMIQKAYPAFDLVTAREPCSLRCLHGLGVTHTRLVPDPVFALDCDTRPGPGFERWRAESDLDGRDYFCFSASGLPVGRPRGQWDGPLVDLVARLQEIVPRAVLIGKDPHCQFLADVARRAGASFFGPGNGYQDLYSLLRGARFLVTGHYHYAIIAAVVGCPSVPLSTNNHKMSGLCELLGQPDVRPFDITHLGGCADEILAAAAELQRQRDVISAELKQRSSELQLQAMGNATMLRDLLTGRGEELPPLSTETGVGPPGAQCGESTPHE